MIIITLYTNKTYPGSEIFIKSDYNVDEYRPGKKVIGLWIAIIMMMTGLYILFN